MPPSPHQQDQPHILRSHKDGKPFSPHPGSAELRYAILHRHRHTPDSGTASAATARAWTRTGRREHPPSAPGWRSPPPQVARWRSPADRMPAFAFAIACSLADARLAITAPRWRAQRPTSTAVATHPQHADPDRHGHDHAAHAPADLATHLLTGTGGVTSRHTAARTSTARHGFALPGTDLPQTADSNIPPNIALGTGCTDFVNDLVRLQTKVASDDFLLDLGGAAETLQNS